MGITDGWRGNVISLRAVPGNHTVHPRPVSSPLCERQVRLQPSTGMHTRHDTLGGVVLEARDEPRPTTVNFAVRKSIAMTSQRGCRQDCGPSTRLASSS
jgi:hypothetical protein